MNYLALSWASAHPVMLAVILWMLVSLVVAVTPVRYRNARWYGGLVRLADRLSGLTHPDAIGTVKLPGLASAISPEVAAALAVAQVAIPKPPAVPGNPGFATARSMAIAFLLAAGVMIAFVVVGASVHGCSGTQRQYTPPENALLGIHLTAHGVQLADHLIAPRCNTATPPNACTAVVTAYGASRATLTLSEQAAQDWQHIADAPSECRLSRSLSDAQHNVLTLLAALDSMHIEPPADLANGATQVAGLIAAHAPACGDGGL